MSTLRLGAVGTCSGGDGHARSVLTARQAAPAVECSGDFGGATRQVLSVDDQGQGPPSLLEDLSARTLRLFH